MDVSPNEVRIRAIGVVRNGVRSLDRRDWSGVRSRVELRPGVEESLLGLRDYSHVIVLGWLHLVPAALRERRRAYPAGDERLPLQGALALRGAARPNPLAVTVCGLVAVEEPAAGEGAALVVSGLDLVDGTPVLDVKPYIAAYDSVPGATLPRWARG
ncbi:MAG: SAM-dependent methyltransferase [Chloroflexi bacterium]|nr:SAM-dependent methyltransferase [Chloroflexota bacterium]